MKIININDYVYFVACVNEREVAIKSRVLSINKRTSKITTTSGTYKQESLHLKVPEIDGYQINVIEEL